MTETTGVQLTFFEMRTSRQAMLEISRRRRKRVSRTGFVPPPGHSDLNIVEADQLAAAAAKLTAAMEAKWPGRDARLKAEHDARRARTMVAAE